MFMTGVLCTVCDVQVYLLLCGDNKSLMKIKKNVRTDRIFKLSVKGIVYKDDICCFPRTHQHKKMI